MNDGAQDGSGANILNGVRVLDLSRVLAGPLCSQMLADFGAEVIKVERPGTGDETRTWGPPWVRDQAGDETTDSSYFLCANRAKLSVTVDMNVPEGLEVVEQLAESCDVLIENFKVGGLKKYGLDYETVSGRNPGVIYASISGFGTDGPRANEPGYDYLAQAMTGLMSITGRADGEPGAGPLRTGVAITDQASGLFCAIAILGALFHRERTGIGQRVDVSLFDAGLALLVNQALSHFVSGQVPTRTGEWHPSLAPYQPFDVADGRIVIAVGNNGQFGRLCEFLGVPELAIDRRFKDNPDRNRHRLELAGLLQGELRALRAEEVLAGLRHAGVPAAPINDIAAAFADPQATSRQRRVELDHGAAGTVPGIANPISMSRTPIEYRHGPPLLGEHTEYVLTELVGLDGAEVEQLRNIGAI